MKPATRLLLLTAVSVPLLACGGGVPITVRIDEFTIEVDLDPLADMAFAAQGLVGDETSGFPERWPDSLPDIKYRALLTSPPAPVDLTPEEPQPDPETGEIPPEELERQEMLDKYEQINDVIRRIEFNRIILRIEASTLAVPLPELRLQVAAQPDTLEQDRLAWRTVAILPSKEPGFIGDVELEFVPGGESYLSAQLSDDDKDFAMRVRGLVDIDTAANPIRPGGKAIIRLVAVATFFVEPSEAL